MTFIKRLATASHQTTELLDTTMIATKNAFRLTNTPLTQRVKVHKTSTKKSTKRSIHRLIIHSHPSCI